MPTLNIALAQINPTIGDIDGNLALMIAAARRAHAEGAQLRVRSRAFGSGRQMPIAAKY